MKKINISLVLIAALFLAACKENSDSIVAPANSLNTAGSSVQGGQGGGVQKEELNVPSEITYSLNGSNLSVSWQSVEGASGYQIVFTQGGLSSIQLTENRYSVELNSGSYAFKIRALAPQPGQILDSPFSSETLFTVNDKLSDTTPPVITYTLVSASIPGTGGWYKNDVLVKFSASDPESAVTSVTPDVNVNTEGIQTVTGTAYNAAGLSASVSVEVKLDKTIPAVSITAPEYAIMGGSVNLSGSASDLLSGLNSALLSINGASQQNVSGSFNNSWTPSSTGEFTVSLDAKDNATNTASISKSVKVVYQFSGWRQPVVNTSKSFKSGSMLPVKFIVTDANGKPVTSGLNVLVTVGSVSANAVLDDASTGQWKAEIKLAGSGSQTVSLSGNITPSSLEITVKL